jgi:hypothetical protein
MVPEDSINERSKVMSKHQIGDIVYDRMGIQYVVTPDKDASCVHCDRNHNCDLNNGDDLTCDGNDYIFKLVQPKDEDDPFMVKLNIIKDALKQSENIIQDAKNEAEKIVYDAREDIDQQYKKLKIKQDRFYRGMKTIRDSINAMLGE